MKPTKADVLEFLNAEVESQTASFRARSQSADSWSGGTAQDWVAVGCKLSASQRQKVAEGEARIALKIQDRIHLLKAAIEFLK